MTELLVVLGVAALGGLGAVARRLVGAAVSARTGNELPWGTFVVNVSGACALGVLVGLGARGDTLLLVGTATLGSYTTFSTWMLESHRLGEARSRRDAVVNVVGSLVLGLAAAWVGRAIGRAA